MSSGRTTLGSIFGFLFVAIASSATLLKFCAASVPALETVRSRSPAAPEQSWEMRAVSNREKPGAGGGADPSMRLRRSVRSCGVPCLMTVVPPPSRGGQEGDGVPVRSHTYDLGL